MTRDGERRAANSTDALLKIAEESPELLHAAPHSTAVSRPDEVKAARSPVLKAE
ncbi:MAG TPA: hypothetical protein VNH11_15605 [Pirellulales bacterium]|nr:hypothetical protein [Pirellulales bacterium]